MQFERLRGSVAHILGTVSRAKKRRPTFLIFFFGLSVASAGLFLATTNYFFEESRDVTSDSRRLAIGRVFDQFTGMIPLIAADAVLVSDLPALRRYAEFRNDSDGDEIEQYFELVVRGNRAIEQFRYLDLTGMERIRVDRIGDTVVRVEAGKLQNKSDRYYFTDAVNIPRHSFYVSQLDLNVENGAIEVPWKPMLRIAAPIFGSDGDRKGVVVVNVNARHLMDVFKERPEDGSATYLLNSKGYFLAGADPAHLWGFMFDRPDTYGARNAEIWARARDEGNGQLRQGDVIYTYRTLVPLDALRTTFAGRNAQFQGPVGEWLMLDVRRVAFADFIGHVLSTNAFKIAMPLTILLLLLISWIASGVVADRRRLSALQRTQERRMRDFVDHTGATMYIRDRAGRFTFTNREFTRNLGKEPDELIGRFAREVLPADLCDRLDTIERKAHSGAGGAGVEIDIMVDGEERTLFVNVFDLFDEQGRPDAICSIGIDITKLKVTEAALRDAKTIAEEAKSMAETAAEAKANFLAAMSHEIRTPMNGVVGMIDVMAETDLDDDQRKMVSVVKTSAYSLLGIIGDILDFSKLEAGRMKLESVPITIVDIMESVGINLWAGAMEKSLMFPMFCDPKIPPRVFGDPVRLRQILVNLIGNAIKFTETTPERVGKVVVRADLMAEVMDRVQIRFSVADNGIGMDADALSRLFQPFEQADVSTVRRFGGTGLGLSICKQLALLMGGDISVESTPGEGSTFSVDFWFDTDVATARDSDLGGLRVLMILRRDIPEAADFMARYLNYWKCETEIAYEFDEARKVLRTRRDEGRPFDIVVIGRRLPASEKLAFRESIVAMPGFEAMRFVFLDFDYQRVPMSLSENSVTVTAAPICRTSFVTAVAIAAGRASPETLSLADEAILPQVEVPTIEQARANGQLILVAEDNETNREVLRRQLNVLGYAAVIEPDGLAALETYRSGSFALLLTDCHMPNMDGYQLTEAIRADERGTGRHLPIVAVTANALHGEAERCLKIGMDDFVVKPIDLQLFRAKLQKWMQAGTVPAGRIAETVPESPSAADPDEAPAATDSAAILDVSVLSRLIGGDRDTIVAILGDFVAPAQRIADDIAAGYSARDAASIEFGGHKLKSSARAIGALKMADLCAALEQAGKSEDWAAIDRLAPELNTMLAEVVAAIEQEQQEGDLVET